LVVLKGFFDGSGKPDDPECDFLTLAGYAAPPGVWPAFELRWQSILEKHGEQRTHMNDRRYREKPVLIAELLETIDLAGHFGMRSAAVTVDLTAYRSLSGMRHSPGRICVQFCIDELLKHAGSISCFFDRGEEFFKEVSREWEHEKPGAEWRQLAKVRELAVLRGLDVPGIQAADLLAWYANRAVTKSVQDLELALAENRAPGVFKLFDVTALYELGKRI
jgi:hypothetical protein